MSNFSEGWYLIYTRPRHEKKVHSSLSQKNIHAWLPTRKTLRVWHDRKKFVDEPLFPSYVFIYLKDMQSYYQGLDTDGFLYYVRSGKNIARVSETTVHNIRIATEGAAEVEVSDHRFLPGDQLVVNSGPLTGLNCEVVNHKDTKMLLVRVSLLQRNLLMKLPVEQLMQA